MLYLIVLLLIAVIVLSLLILHRISIRETKEIEDSPLRTIENTRLSALDNDFGYPLQPVSPSPFPEELLEIRKDGIHYCYKPVGHPDVESALQPDNNLSVHKLDGTEVK